MLEYKDLNDYEIIYMVSENDENARDLIFKKYEPIAVAMAKKYSGIGKKYGLEIEDLIQEALIGLDTAMKSFDTKNNALFYTFAIITMKNKILNCINSNSSNKQKSLNQSISLFTEVSNDGNNELIDYIEDKNTPLPQKIVVDRDLENIIRKFMASLEFSTSCIFELKMNGFSNNDISELLDCTKREIIYKTTFAKKRLKDFLCRLEF